MGFYLFILRERECGGTRFPAFNIFCVYALDPFIAVGLKSDSLYLKYSILFLSKLKTILKSRPLKVDLTIENVWNA